MPFVTVEGARFHYRTSGDGPTDVVFVHGFCQSSLYWEPSLGSLPSSCRGFALDLRGFGDSDKPEEPYTLPVLADEVAAFLDALGLNRVALVGNSMGGVVCQAFATRHRGRLSKLALLSTGPFVRDPVAARDRARRFATMAWEREAFSALIARFFVRRPDNFEELVDVAMRASRRAMVEITLSMASLSFLEALRGLAVPTLIVQGAEDTIRPPEEGRLLHEAVEGSRFFVLEGASHTPMLERPEQLHALLWDFLATPEGGGSPHQWSSSRERCCTAGSGTTPDITE